MYAKLETARNFFVKYLGAKSNEGYHNTKTSFRSYFLSFDDGARLEIMNKLEMPDFPKEFARTGYAHIAFSVGGKEKVDALTAELKADRYEVVNGPRTTGDSYGREYKGTDFENSIGAVCAERLSGDVYE
ncbi:VOC family protein [Laedolimicola intestinihominis]|uniref:VOC family protein n=1 Tax=Laedolimicola intestinihominis TaxID=3133166 RepID=A0ABV1FD78_9FIRM